MFKLWKVETLFAESWKPHAGGMYRGEISLYTDLYKQTLAQKIFFPFANCLPLLIALPGEYLDEWAIGLGGDILEF